MRRTLIIRGIAVGSIVGKLFNLVFLSRLEKRIQTTNPISCNQIGFIKGHRTAAHIFALKSIGKIVRVERRRLFVKHMVELIATFSSLNCKKNGIRVTFYRNIKAMYNSYKVKVRGGTLDPITSRLGLKHGGGGGGGGGVKSPLV